MTIKITRFHKFENGSLLGFLDVAIPLWGTFMNIKGCKIFIKDGKQSITLPSREYQDEAGEKKYAAIIGIDDIEVFKKLMNGIRQAWTEYCSQNSQPPQQLFEAPPQLFEAPPQQEFIPQQQQPQQQEFDNVPF